MSVLPGDFESHSSDLEENFSSEISIRCAISRLYYYMFHSMREQNSGDPQARFSYGGGDHAAVMEFLRNINEHDLADDYHDLKVRREEADYDIGDDFEDIDLQTFKYNVENFELEAKQKNILS
jgi:hypothetical protein